MERKTSRRAGDGRGVISSGKASSNILTIWDGVEHHNLTVRQQARRMGRKVNAFSKDKNDLEYQLPLAFAYDHFVVPHRSLRQRLPHPMPSKGHNGSPKKWQPVPPAMAAGFTDQVWTMDEVLSFRGPPHSLW